MNLCRRNVNSSMIGQRYLWGRQLAVVLHTHGNMALIKIIGRTQNQGDKKNVRINELIPAPTKKITFKMKGCPHCGTPEPHYVPGLECPGCGEITNESFAEWLERNP